MPFAIRAGGEVHTGHERTPEEEATPRTHAGFLLWDYYIGLLTAREEAVQLFIQYENFGKQIDHYGIEHRKFGQAMQRLFGIENRIIQEQIGFLTYERYADKVWRRMLQRERVSEGACDLYRVPKNRETLLGLWPHVFGEGSGTTDGGFPIHHVAMLLATSEQEREYVFAKFGKRVAGRSTE